MLCTRCHHFEAAPDGVLCAQCAASPGFQAPPPGAPKLWLRSPVGLGRATVQKLWDPRRPALSWAQFRALAGRLG